ncbi:hypothetical protein RCL1_006912 [Eukaryota sp. TZLM3-RCL]
MAELVMAVDSSPTFERSRSLMSTVHHFNKESLLEHTYSDPIITSDIHNSIYGRVGYGGGFKSHFRRRRSLISTIHHFNKESLLEHTYSDPVITSDIHNRIYGRVGYGGGFKSHFRKKQEFDIDCSPF